MLWINNLVFSRWSIPILKTEGSKYPDIILYRITMNKRHRRTLDVIFAHPISGNIKWKNVESLLRNLSADLTERSGSRVALSLNNCIAMFHRPHTESKYGQAGS